MSDNVKMKVPPNSKESEMMVLGCMLTSINALNAAADMLDEGDFYYNEHKLIFQALKTAYANEKPADIHLICEELKRIDKLSAVGGVSYVTSLAQYAGTSAYIEEYAELVQSKSILRKMVYAAQEIEKTALTEPDDVHEALDTAQAKFYSISQNVNAGFSILIKDLLSGAKSSSKIPYLKELQERQENFFLKGPSDPGITGIPTHFIDLDKIVNGLGASNLIILAARPAMGKCVTGDTQIIDPTTGALHSIKELVDSGSGHVATLSHDWTLQTAHPTGFVADGIKPTFRITTALGREIEATAVHPLLTITGWKRLEELEAGERIAVPRILPYFGVNEWPEHELKALGYFIGDGCLVKGNPGFKNSNPKIVSDFKNAISSFGPVRIREEIGSDRTPSYFVVLDRKPLQDLKEKFASAIHALAKSKRKQLYQLVESLGFSKTNVCLWALATTMPSSSTCAVLEETFPELPSFAEAIRNNPVTAWLERVGVAEKDAHQKTLPSAIFELTKSNIALLINRLFSCDGTAYISNSSGQSFPVIAYASVSKTLIYQIQHLLLRFGILSKIRTKKTNSFGKVFPSFELEIHGKENITLFCKEIGIFGKEEAVSKVLERALSTTPGWSKDTIPFPIWELIRFKKGDRSWRSLFKMKGFHPPSNLYEGKRSPRRETLAKLAFVLDDLELKQIAESDVYWDRIVSIEYTGEKEVFDLTVEQTHNFIAGDIIVHNTALALNIAENVCFKNNLPVGIFSLEMSAEQLLHRVICSQAEVEADKIRTGSLNGTEFQRIVASVNTMQKHTMIIDDQPGLKITDLRSRARRMKESFGISLLIVDYLQLLSGSGYSKSAENRQNEISEISRMLKNLAREINVPVICLSQLSRKVEERQGHRPMMSDLRESGCLTGDALIKDALSGKLYTIQELAERKEQTPIFVHAVDHRLKIGPHKMVKAFYSGKKTVYELTTKTGRSIKASANHPFLKMEGWTSLDKLKKGDRIGVPQNRLTTNPTFEGPEFLFEQNPYLQIQEGRSPKGLMGQMSFPVVIPMESSSSAHLFSTGSSSSRKQRFVPTFHKARALRLGQEDVHWDEIESILELKEVDVYDATVEGVHNFVANDIVVHNSIEQDADIVMFLLRREYYDPYDKPGTAELIIAKNRHGGVGSVNLTFRKEVAQFANFTPMYKQDKDENDSFSAFSPNT